MMNQFQEHALPIVEKISQEKHVAAIQAAFGVAMPFALIGSLMMLVAQFRIDLLNPTLPLVQDPYQRFWISIFGPHWTDFPMSMANVSVNLVSVLLTVGVAYRLTESYRKDGSKFVAADPLLISFTALVAAFIIFPSHQIKGLGQVWTMQTFAAPNIFLSLLVGIGVAEMMIHLNGLKIRLKLPTSIPGNILTPIDEILPLLISLLVVNTFKFLGHGFGIYDFGKLIGQFLQVPIMNVIGTIFGFAVFEVLGNAFFYCGLHQNTISAIRDPFFSTNTSEMMRQLSNGTNVWHMHGAAMNNINAFINYLGGTGATLALIFAILIVGRKSVHYSQVAKLGLIPGLFSINEPIIYGLPVVFNPFLLIPFVFATSLTSVVYYALTLWHVLPNIPYTVPWTTPPLLNAYLASGGQMMAVVGQLAVFIVDVLIYIPFVRLAINAETKKQMKKG